MAMVKLFFAVLTASIFTAISSSSMADNPFDSAAAANPFRAYPKAIGEIFVYNESLFSKYNGPSIENTDQNYESNRLGIITVAPNRKYYIDATADPTSNYFEILDIRTGKLIHKFKFHDGIYGSLLFTGNGVVYEYMTNPELCWGTITIKYNFVNDALLEVEQPLQYMANTSTVTTKDVQLYLAPDEKSQKVASLAAKTQVAVLSSKKGSWGEWALVQTPLGLTGWVKDGLEIFLCN